VKVPFGNLQIHYRAYKIELDLAVGRVLESGHYILGPELENFERKFAQYLGANYVAGCASGTEAIYLALVAAGIQEGDEVLVVAHTAVPTISAISMSGAKPVFVDIDADTCLMNIDRLETKVSSKTKAIIPVHLYGQMVDMEPVLKTAAKYNLSVIEDVAQATGATYRGAKAGTLGDFGAFSFYPSKNLGCFGDGGAVTTKTQDNFERLTMLRNYGQSRRYNHDTIGINSRLDEIQAAILTAQLPFVPKWNQRRRDIAKRYSASLNGIVETPVSKSDHVFHLYVIQVDERDKLQAYLMERGVQCLIHYPIPAHLQKAYSYLGYKPGDLPVTERVASRILSLPMFPELTEEQIDYVINCIKDFYAKPAVVKQEEVSGAVGIRTAIAQQSRS
jgi:dTDP-4-amino-4,6-dideoxygalactose transaminase